MLSQYCVFSDVGLGQAHMAMERTRHIQQSIEQLMQYNNHHQKNRKQQTEELVDQSLILQLQSQSQLNAMLTATHDSWLVLYVEAVKESVPEAEGSTEVETGKETTTFTMDEILNLATELTNQLEDSVNIAIFDSSNAPNNVNMKKDDSGKRVYSLRLHGGDVLHNDTESEQALNVAQAIKRFAIDESGVLYAGDVTKVEDIVTFVKETMAAHKWQPGSVNTMTVMVQNMLVDAAQHIRYRITKFDCLLKIECDV